MKRPLKLITISDGYMKKRYSTIICMAVPIILILTSMTALAGVAPIDTEPYSLISVPTADVSRYGDFTIGYSQAGKRMALGFTYGLTDEMQVGMSASSYGDSNVDFSGAVKVRIKDEDSQQPALALGLADNSVYAVASKKLLQVPGLRGHVGFGAGKFDGLFFGLTKVVNPVTIKSSKTSWSVPVVTFMAEMVRKELNFGARLEFTPDFKVDIGVRGGGELHMDAGYTMGF